MKTMITAFGLLALSALPVLATPQADVNAALRGDTEIWDGLFAIAVAREVRDNCEAIDSRDWSVRMHILGLYNRARGLGFSRDEIGAFIDDDTEKARLREQVLAYFNQNGVRLGVPETYCTLGQSEIASGSQAGDLLRAR